MKYFRVLALLAGMLTFGGLAYADTIGPDCGSCNGATYTLTYVGDPNSESLTVTLTIDTSLAGFDLPGSFIDNVGFKNTTDLDTATLLSAPGGLGNWTTDVDSGINANGCSGSGNGFLCSDAASSVATGGVLVWTWNVTLTSGGSFSIAPGGSSVKVRFVDGEGDKVGSIVSELITLQPGTQVPEPATLTLLGTGLVGLAGVIRRRMKKS